MILLPALPLPMMRGYDQGQMRRSGAKLTTRSGRSAALGGTAAAVSCCSALWMRANSAVRCASKACHCWAERLAFEDGRFDLVVSYLSLIDIPDVSAAIAEMARVLRPGGTLLIANLSNFNSAGATADMGWTRLADERPAFALDHYLEERSAWVEWRGIRIVNWHRPLSTYMTLLLDQGLRLTHFDEPAPVGGDPDRAARYVRAPWFMIMEWTRPG
jgi:SAM-dependent methyltransferase